MGLLGSILGTASGIISGGNGVVDWLNRKITECGRVDISSMLRSSFHYNTIISGSNQTIRDMAISKALTLALSSGFPIIELHLSNSPLPNLIKQSVGSGFPISFVNSYSANFSPFWGLSSDDAIEIILDSAPEKFSISPNARYYLEAITDMMTAHNMSASFNNYLTCPHNSLLNKIDSLEMSGAITATQSQDMKSKIMIGQNESFKIDSYLKALNKQMGSALRKRNSKIPESGIGKTIQEHGLISIDIGTSCRSIYVDFLVEIIKNLALKGGRFILVIDSMNIAENKKLKELVSTPLAGSSIIISCDDLLATCSGEENLAKAVLGVTEQFFIFSHASGTSATLWASVIGEYEKTEKSTSTQRGQSYSSDPFDFEPSKNNSRTVTLSKKRDYVVPPEKISNMQASEFYYKVKNTQGVKHCIMA